MRTIAKPAFLKTLSSLGINTSNRDGVLELSFAAPSETENERFWTLPERPQRLPYLVSCMIAAVGDWKSVYLYKPYGGWGIDFGADAIPEQFYTLTYRALGLRRSTSRVLRFGYSEYYEVLLLTYMHVLFGWHVADDMVLVFDNGLYILEVYHHELIRVYFKESASIHKYVSFMAEAEFPLPVRVPDPTVKKPSWMP